MTEQYTPAVFTKENPCSKVELHNCFYRGGKYVARPVVEARTVIGVNAPKFLIREGYVIQNSIKGVDFYCPTPAGREWLEKGIARYLGLHPERALDCAELPQGFGGQLVKRTPTGAAKPPAEVVERRPRLIRRSKIT